MARRKKNMDSRLITALLITVPSTIRGFVPKPIKMDYVDPDVTANSIKRWFDCPNYDKCLDVAALSNWPGWTCRECGIYNTHPDRMLDKRRDRQQPVPSCF